MGQSSILNPLSVSTMPANGNADLRKEDRE